VAITTVVLWLITALLGLNLAVRSGSLEDLLVRQRRIRAGRRALFLLIHILAAVTGLVLWVWFLLSGPMAMSTEALLLLAIAASHGLLMVSRWVPGHGRHARAASSQRHRASYFPVHAATLHAMLAASTVTTVVILTVQMYRH
jgi:hypothetical protein